VLGGLREHQHDVTSSGIPVLSSIPFVGGLFGAHGRRTTETELFLFITPIVLATDGAADSAAARTFEQLERSGLRGERP
jgi:general secretion pathway protein D